MMKMINGNMKGINKLNFLQYNKGNSKYETKEVFLNRVIIENNIDVACICEANITDSYLTNNNILEGFNIETKPLAKNYDLSRNVILIYNKIQYKRRMDLEDNHIATIWLELSINSKKSMLVMGGYRQWRLPK